MSIISDAVKKAEHSKEFRPLYAGDRFKQEIEHGIQKKSRQVNWGPVFVLMVLFLITGPLIAPVFSTTFRHANFSNGGFPSKAAYQIPADTSTQLAALPNAASGTRKAQFGLEEIPLNQAISPKPFLPASMPNLNLTGLVYSKEDSYCIINGKVIKVGDEINGAKLTNVQPSEAKLLYQGKQIVLSVPE